MGGIAIGSILLILFTLFFSGFLFWNQTYMRQHQFLHVTPTTLQIVLANGSALKEYALKDITEIYASDQVTVTMMVWSEQQQTAVEETLRYVADANGLAAAVEKYRGMGIPEPQVTAPDISQRIPLQPHVLAEEEADKLHAAQHLLNQGMISQQQFDEMLMPPQAAQQPDPDEQNADDYFRLQELLAQQISSGPAETAPQTDTERKENEENGRTGLV